MKIEKILDESVDFQDFLNTLEITKLTDDEQVWLSSIGGDEGSGTIVNSVSGCSGSINNCQGGNCIKNCGSGR